MTTYCRYENSNYLQYPIILESTDTSSSDEELRTLSKYGNKSRKNKLASRVFFILQDLFDFS